MTATIEVLFDAATFIDGYDFTCQTNKGSLEAEAEELDATTFCSGGFKARRGGLKGWTLSTEGFWHSAASDAVDPVSFAGLGVAGRVVTVTPQQDEAEGAYLGLGTQFNYALFDANVGELAPFSLSAQGSDKTGLIRGQLAVARTTVTTTGAKGSPVQLGAVVADERLYAAIHLLGTAGTSITLKIQSDNASNFPSATDQATVGSLTAVGGTWMTPVAGAITDDWFRVSVSAISGSWDIAVSIGIA